jgi:hypothetical protein
LLKEREREIEREREEREREREEIKWTDINREGEGKRDSQRE